MARIVHTAAAQMGPIAKSETRKDTVGRLIAMMREAKSRGADLIVLTELGLTTFFPRWLIEDEAELDSYYETEMPGPATQPLFEEAKKLGIGFYLGYAELVREADASAASTPRSWSIARGPSSANTARCICQATPSRSPAAPTSTSRSGISSRAISASGCGGHSAG